MTEAADNVLDFATMIEEDALYITTAAMGLEKFADKAPYGLKSKGAQAVLLASQMLYGTAKILRSAIEAPEIEPELEETQADNGSDGMAVVQVQRTDKGDE